MISRTPKPPYYAVVFTSLRTEVEDNAYNSMADVMLELATKQNGFLGVESARNKLGITVSYWKDLESIRTWKQNIEHINAQNLGKQKWYQNYKVRIAKVERDYDM